MATVILNTCTWPACEMIYDFYIDTFILLLEQLIDIWRSHVANPAWHHHPLITEIPTRISHSISNKGWIPLLYFIAIKCRVHRIRLQAIKLLAKTPHKEGVWNGELMLVVVQEIMRIEEGNYYQDLETDDSFNIFSLPTEQNVSLPPLPESHRLYNVQLGLPEHSMGLLSLKYEQIRENGHGAEAKTRCYDLQTQNWVDKIGGAIT
ncbi:hypothetical protein F5Y19DRAFT_246211 [Xylariaceae sp. FL1651]|nr:hypothetical protein F5Y19DRAFT_246211 [Xylariaceae sp. FL1651]